MRNFKDKSGQDWTIELTFGAVLRVKSLSDNRFDLLRPEQAIKHPDFGDTVLQVAILLDLPTFWEVLYFCVAPQCVERNISTEAFGELMAADCLIAARAAFRQEWQDFFLHLQRPDQAKALEKLGQWMEAGMKTLAEVTAKADLSSLDRKVLGTMNSILNRTSGNLVASWDSIPDRSHIANST